MVKLRSHYTAKRGLEDHISDRNTSVARCGIQTRKALANSDALANKLGAPRVVRTLFVFVDNHKDADTLACVVFSLGDHTTLLANVDNDGHFVGLTRYNVRTDKRMSQEWIYRVLGYEYHKNDPQREKYHNRVYARNRTCYK